LGPKNVDLQTYIFTTLPFLSENIKSLIFMYYNLINQIWTSRCQYIKHG